MFCRNCGNQLPENSKFCDRCGAKVEVVQPDHPITNQQPVRTAQPVSAQKKSQPKPADVKKAKKSSKKGILWKVVAVLLIALFAYGFAFPELTIPEFINAVKNGEPLHDRSLLDLDEALSEKKAKFTIFEEYWDTDVCSWSEVEEFIVDYIFANPEYYYVDFYNSTLSYVENEGEVMSFTIEFAYFDDLVTDNAQQQMKQKADRLIAGVPAGSSDWEKALYLHDELIRNVSYKEGSKDQNAYAALVEGEAVCMGYAMAYEYLLTRAGIKCDTVIGYSSDFAAAMDGTLLEMPKHAWTVVTFKDGGSEKSYFVDTTWDDYGMKDKYGEEYISHRWFCVSYEDIVKEGRSAIDAIYDLSKWDFSDNSMNYFVSNDAFIDSYDFDEVVDIFERQIAQGNNFLSLRVADMDTYYDLSFDIENNGGFNRLCEALGLYESVAYRFTYRYQGDGLICFEVYLNYQD